MSKFENYTETSSSYDKEREPVGADVIAGLLHVHAGKPLKVRIYDISRPESQGCSICDDTYDAPYNVLYSVKGSFSSEIDILLSKKGFIN